MERLKVKNWAKYQHYKDRCPPWIKLATNTFQDYEFSRLQDASKLLAVCIWTLASREQDASVPHDLAYIKSQCCLGELIEDKHLNELIEKGFLDASNTLASCKQSAIPEERRGETETETEGEVPHPASASKVKQVSELQSFSSMVCGNVGSTNRWTIEAVESQLQLEQSKSFTLEQAAERMIAAANNYKSKTLDRSKEPTNWWEKFYSTGKWRDWLPDTDKPRRKTAAEEAHEEMGLAPGETLEALRAR